MDLKRFHKPLSTHLPILPERPKLLSQVWKALLYWHYKYYLLETSGTELSSVLSVMEWQIYLWNKDKPINFHDLSDNFSSFVIEGQRGTGKLTYFVPCLLGLGHPHPISSEHWAPEIHAGPMLAALLLVLLTLRQHWCNMTCVQGLCRLTFTLAPPGGTAGMGFSWQMSKSSSMLSLRTHFILSDFIASSTLYNTL